jgi:hypothetical protein
MDEQDVQRSLVWLAERLDQVDKAAGGGDPFLVHHACATCGHSRYAHVVGGDADSPEPWPCEFPKILGAPVGLCDCPDFEPLVDDDDA